MTTEFNGFGGRDKSILIPETFFSDLLPLIDDVAELKVTLFCMWALQQREGRYRYLTEADFRSDVALLAGLEAARPDVNPQHTLSDGLGRAVTRGSLLRAQIPGTDGEKVTLYFMNTERGREAVAAVKQGNYGLFDGQQVEILPPRPNIYRLYEQEIGLLTPHTAETLKDLEKDYPAVWLQEAIEIASERQAKNMKFVRAVLDRWRKEGRSDHEITGRHGPGEAVRDGQRYVSGRYGDYIDS